MVFPLVFKLRFRQIAVDGTPANIMNQNTNQNDWSNRNPVIRRMYDLASMHHGSDRVIIRHFTTRELIPNQRYEWLLFERDSDTAPVDTVSLDVSLVERLQIDDDVSIEIRRTN